MIFVLFYLFVGYVSYPFMARADGITITRDLWLETAVAATVWAIIWLPALLYKISNDGKGGRG